MFITCHSSAGELHVLLAGTHGAVFLTVTTHFTCPHGPQLCTLRTRSLQEHPHTTGSTPCKTYIYTRDSLCCRRVASIRFAKQHIGSENDTMYLTIFILSMFSISAFASPIINRAGAGGPTAKPIPSTCDITNPLPHSNCSTTITTSNYKPASTFASNHTLYES